MLPKEQERNKWSTKQLIFVLLIIGFFWMITAWFQFFDSVGGRAHNRFSVVREVYEALSK